MIFHLRISFHLKELLNISGIIWFYLLSGQAVDERSDRSTNLSIKYEAIQIAQHKKVEIGLCPQEKINLLSGTSQAQALYLPQRFRRSIDRLS